MKRENGSRESLIAIDVNQIEIDEIFKFHKEIERLFIVFHFFRMNIQKEKMKKGQQINQT